MKFDVNFLLITHSITDFTYSLSIFREFENSQDHFVNSLITQIHCNIYTDQEDWYKVVGPLELLLVITLPF